MANIVKTYTFVNSQPADATQVNKNFDDIIAGVGDISAAGHAFLDDTTPAAQIATLGTAAYSEGTWTPVLTGFTFVGAAPVVSGTYRRIGSLVFAECQINAGTGGNTSVAITSSSYISGLPVSVSNDVPFIVTSELNATLPGGRVTGSVMYFGSAISAQTYQIDVVVTYAC